MLKFKEFVKFVKNLTYKISSQTYQYYLNNINAMALNIIDTV